MGKKKANQLGRSLIKDRYNQGHRKKVDNGTMVRKNDLRIIFKNFTIPPISCFVFFIKAPYN